MPQYLLLIYNPAEGGPTPEEQAAQQGAWMSYTEELRESGLMVAGDALQPVSVATTVRVRDGETQITDGPFAETREQLAGYYAIDAPDLDTALRWAERMPNVGYGSVEVRPIWDTTQPPASAEQAAAQA